MQFVAHYTRLLKGEVGKNTSFGRDMIVTSVDKKERWAMFVDGYIGGQGFLILLV